MPAKGLPIADRSRGRPFEKGKSGNPVRLQQGADRGQQGPGRVAEAA
jgi:hypothetical protein